MKSGKKGILVMVGIMLSTAVFGLDLNFKFYPGMYLGGDPERDIDDGLFVIGVDLQAGFEFGDMEYDTRVFTLFANMGIDTGQPNEPNIYAGLMPEFYFFGDSFKVGMALGCGYNLGLSELQIKKRAVRDTFYFRFGIPVYIGDLCKTGLYLDYYIGAGARLGLLFHYNLIK
jgi:hypothetical protein